MQGNRPVYLTLRGIPLGDPPTTGELFFRRRLDGEWRPSVGDVLGDIDIQCVQLHDALASAIFGSSDRYWALLRRAPLFLSDAGLNSESPISSVDFEKLVAQLPPEPTNRFLYLYDCRKVVSGIQECAKEAVALQGEFFRTLNLDELFEPPVAEPDGVRWMTSPIVTKLHALLGFIFIRLHSLLDYTTKLAHEVEHLQGKFDVYPRLASSKILFGDRKHLSLSDVRGTLFEPCDVVVEIEAYRNHIIHSGLLDDMPKVYKMVVGGEPVEKFILLPDRRADGRFEKYGNRSLFYGREDKINLRLPLVVSSFQDRLLATLKIIFEDMQRRGKAPCS